ncbi:fimbrial protein [Enterobacter sp. Acro-832]|uniref:fimbrial protein n=1 Tax=Enterobacter sp. Acro-832 TaxID=2608348 RepID=UPI001420B1C2|nr:fimbrial protein [Enterobacter sp. Acro-832]NIG42383.1 fimbrial protein [Enterobacter sp. Acro-832]
MNRVNKNILKLALASVLTLLSFNSFALVNCRFVGSNAEGSETVSFGDIIVQRDAPVGTVLGTINLFQRYLSRGNIADCPRTGGYLASIDVGSEFSRVTFNGQELFETGVPGIAIRVKAINTNKMPRTTGAWCVLAATTIRWCASTSWGNASNGYNLIELVKIGKTASGVIKPGEIMIRGFTNGEGRVFTTNLTSSKITTVACSVVNSNIQVNMNPASATDFRKNSGVAGKTDFKIDLDCDASTNVNVTIDPGSAGAENSANGILKLDNAGGQTASGIGLQILSQGVPVQFGQMKRIGTTNAEGAFSVPLQAQYIQTAADITAGKANASATFTMTYQ